MSTASESNLSGLVGTVLKVCCEFTLALIFIYICVKFHVELVRIIPMSKKVEMSTLKMTNYQAAQHNKLNTRHLAWKFQDWLEQVNYLQMSRLAPGKASHDLLVHNILAIY